MTKLRILSILIVPCVLQACTTAVPPVEVTRFHDIAAATSEVYPRGSIATFSLDDARKDSLEYRTYAEAVTQELLRLGYRPVGADAAATADYAAYLTVESGRMMTGDGRSPVSVGVGGSTGDYGSGVGLGIGINLGGGPKEKISTELFVRIVELKSGKAVWEGRAETVMNVKSAAAQEGLAAPKLAGALFRDFPGVSGATIKVP